MANYGFKEANETNTHFSRLPFIFFLLYHMTKNSFEVVKLASSYSENPQYPYNITLTTEINLVKSINETELV